MNNSSTNDEKNDQEQSIATNKRLSRPELLTKIYYPDTLYPDSYTFFADRRSPQLNSQSMDTNDQYSTTDPPEISRNNTATIPNQTVVEIEMTERQSKYSSPIIDRERAESESERRRFDVKRYIPGALRTQDKTQPPRVLLDNRFYTMKKTAMTILCLLIIIMSNSVQLKHVLKQGSSHQFYSTQIILGIISVFMCACIGLILMYVIRIDLNDQYKQHKLDYIDNCVICLLFILAIFNIFIAACS